MNNNFWINELKDIFSFIGINENNKSEKNYKDLKIYFSDELIIFLDKNDCSMLEFITAILTVYFSRTNNTMGSIFNYKNKTLFKIKYDKDKDILEYLSDVKKDIIKFNSHSMDDFKGFIENNYSEIADSIYTYSITDLDNNYNTNSIINFKIGDNFLEIQYDAHSFNNKEICSLCNNIEALIFNCLKNFDLKCGEIGIISDDELKLINEYSQGSNMHVDDLNVPDIIKNTSNKYPDNIAISDEVNQITYKKLDELINSTAFILQNKYNIKKNDKIILYLSRSYNFPVLTLSLMRLGAISIPVDDTYPTNYVNDIITDSSPKFLVCEKDYGFKEINIIYVEDLDPKYSTGDFNDVAVDLDDTAIILYTSGTTGKPKGVEITQRNIININYNYVNYFNLSHESGYFMCLAKFTFVASIPVYGSLMRGFEAFIIRDTTKESIPKIVKYLMTSYCSVLISTQELGLYLYNNFDLNIDYLALSGSKLVKSTVKKGNKTKLLNGYGCTETTGSVIINEIDDEFSNYSVIGKPFANCNVYILDDDKQQVPLGTIGEIVISGPTVSKQYYNNPDQTEKAYGIVNNQKAYFTSDLGYFNHDGDIVYVGRKDNQINLNGFRVEPEGIESNILKYGNISQVKVIVNKINNQDHLVAYFSSSKEIDKEHLKEFLSIHLPSYMIPSFYIQMETLPLNPNGKIDIGQLPAVEFKKADYVESRDELEEKVVNSFENAFNQNNISIYDDFIQLGGTSVIAMKILSQLNEFNLSVQDLVTLGSPQKIAEHIKNDDEYFDLNWDKYDLESGCPLNEPQLNVYLDIQRYGKNEEYNIPLTFNIPDIYSKDDVGDALNKMFSIHPILKTHIETIDEMPYLKSGNNPKIEYLEEYGEDYISNFMNNAFDLESNLSRYLLVNDGNNLVLVAVFHHLIFDGFSGLVFKQHLSDLLEGKSLEYDDAFIKSSIVDENISETSKYNEAKIFYESMLSEADEIDPLLTDIGDIKSGTYSFDLKIDKSDITNFLKTCNITENVLFTSVFAYTLSRFTGDDQVLFNIVETGRDKLNNFNSIGMFVNTLPLLVNCKNQQISSFMTYTSDLIYNVMKYNYYPFRILAKEHNINLNIIFQFLPDRADNDNQEEYYENLVSEYNDVVNDLNVEVIQHGFNYSLKIISSDKYSQDFIKRFSDSYKLILHDMLNVDILSDINYITSSDINLLDSYNQTETHFEYNDILDRFNDILVKYEENVLVGYKNNAYTHGQGAFIANEIAEKLSTIGINKQDFVALFVNRSEWFLLASMGVLTSGAIYVPIETKYPEERIVLMLKDTKSKAVIVDNQNQQYMEEIIIQNNLDINILNVSDIVGKNIKSTNYLNTVKVNEEDIACVLYTSGTTGTPKGVLITRKAINNFVSWYVDETNFTFKDTYGMHCSYVFDIHTAALYSPIITGGSLYIVPEDIRLNLKALNDYFVKHNCTHTYITSQVGKLFAESGMKTSIKLLCFGGMKLGELNAPDSIGPFESYGPSENLAISTSIFANKRIHPSSIGYFIDNVKGYVLDNEQRRVPIGAVGELYLSGHQLTPGYLNRDEENNNAFFTNTFDNKKGYEYIYRTGDLVRFLSDGTLSIIGRQDNQVKIRGNRVELTEVESAIRNMSIIDDVTVQTIKNNENNELAAYIVTSSDLTDNDLFDHICDYVSKYKPDYMIPSYIVKLDHIPLTVNGKVDKRALPEIDLNCLRAEYIAPTTETEKIIVDAFEKVFDQERIGIHDDFIRLGGDSLTAIRLLSYLDDYDISVGDILSLHTPYAIAKNISNHSFDLDIYSLESGCPLSESQLNVYLDILSNNKIDSYLIPLSMSIPKKYGLNIVRDALNAMFEVHPILGMHISDEFEVPYLVKGDEPSIIFRDVSTEDFIIEFLTKPMDLNKSLSRFLIVEDGENYSLFAVFHHIIFDATSSSVFKRDMQSILNGSYPEIESSFLKESAFNQQIKETDRYNEAKTFYDYMLVDSDETNDFLDVVGADGPGFCSGELKIDLNEFLSENNISENVLFTSVFAYTMSRFTGNSNVLFNIIENGRSKFNNFDSIGMYVNTLPILIDCKNQDISSFMHNVSDVVYNVMKYDYYPFRLLANEYEISSSILFQYLPYWAKTDDDSSNDLFVKSIEDMDDLIGDFNVNIIQTENSYNISIAYSDKFSSDYVNRFINSYKSILEEMAVCSELSELSYVSNSDLMLLDSYNKTEHDLAHDDILNAFNDNLMEYPNNKLVSYKDNSYTYEEGAFIADKLARKLMELGFETQDCVSFLVERSELYVFCILGIMSAGGVYVPVDDKLPDERVKFIFEDTDSSVVIVSDETYRRAENLINDDVILLNISDIFNDDIGSLSDLPVCYGNLASIFYTSGTSGIPKGVKITRKSIINFAHNYIKRYALSRDDIFALFASIGFDVSMEGIFSSIYAGACLNIIPDDIKVDMDDMNEHFIENGVTYAHLPAQIAKLFINQNNTSLKVLCTGGEKLGDIEIAPVYRFVDTYGPTETFIDVTSINVSDKVDSSSIGHLFDNIKAYVLDEELRRVPIGAVGELYLAGYQVAKGYLNRPKETDEVFLENPYDNNEDYSVLYRTGDMVRVLPDGSFGIVGRHDSQVKIRGNRVELSEIEAVIREIEYIDDVTIQTIKHDANNVLVAYVVINETNIDNLKDDISKYVGDRKPDYMVPSFVIKLNEIPLNINGKVDKRALPEVDLELLHADYVAPRNEKEKNIVEAFEKAFDMENISVHDDFIRLGGDSLTAIKLLHYIDSDSITMADILKLRTPEAIAENMDDFSFDLDIYSLEEGCPLNSAQINVLADVTIYNKTNAYHIPNFIKISKEYSLENILDALDRLLDAHPILSMRLSKIYEVDEENKMSNLEMIRDSISIAQKFGIKDITEIVKSYGIRNVKGLYNMLQTAMKLLKGEYPYLIRGGKPPVSVHKFDKDVLIDFVSETLDLYDHLSKFMIMESEDSYYLFFLIHHIIFDATSHRVFNRDFQTILDGGSVDLDDTFLKVSAFTHHIKNTDKFDEAGEFFGSMLADVNEAGILTEEKPSATGYSMSKYDLEIDKNALDSYLKNAGVSANVLFTSVFAYSLSKFVEGDKVLFTMIENGRDRFNEDFIDMTSNVMPLLIDCKDQSINSFLENTSDIVYGAMKYSYYPILLLYQKYNFEVNILFQFLPDWVLYGIEDMGDISSSEIIDHVLNSYNDFLTELFVQVNQNGEDISLIVINSKRYSDEKIKDFMDTYVSILLNIISADEISALGSILNDKV